MVEFGFCWGGVGVRRVLRLPKVAICLHKDIDEIRSDVDD